MDLMPEVQYEKPDWSNILHGKFALVGFIGGQRKKTHYKYVCCVQYVEEEQEISVTGYKCHSELATVFVVKENDECVVTLNQILALLPDPEMKETDRKINHIFPGSLNVFEKYSRLPLLNNQNKNTFIFSLGNHVVLFVRMLV